jgi:hypothetical protein
MFNMQAPTVGKVEGEVVEQGDFIRVVFQRGLPQTSGVNGCRVEDVIAVALERIRKYQTGSLACEENEEAMRALRAAMRAMESRKRRRIEQGVFSTMKAHIGIRTEDEHEDFSATGA